MGVSMRDCIAYIKSDLYRYRGVISLKDFLYQYFIVGEGFRYSVWLRVCHFSRKRKSTKLLLYPIAKLLYKHYGYKYGISISFMPEIGRGLLIHHFGGIVFVPKKCGNNATISHCTTVGMRIYDGEKKYPVIGDNFYMAPGSKAVGDILIGDNVALGTNCVLLNSVEDNSVVVGMPGKVISNKGNTEYINHPILKEQ